MHTRTNRERPRRDEQWITPRQTFTCVCWGALLLVAAFYDMIQPLLD
jgi:hypothetical protein